MSRIGTITATFGRGLRGCMCTSGRGSFSRLAARGM
jgi:hypothetical protein